MNSVYVTREWIKLIILKILPYILCFSIVTYTVEYLCTINLLSESKKNVFILKFEKWELLALFRGEHADCHEEPIFKLLLPYLVLNNYFLSLTD